MPAGTAMPERRHPQRPVASEVESLEVPAVEEVIPVLRDLVRIGLVGERQDVQAELPRTGYLLAPTAGLVGPQTHPQGRVPAEEGAHARGDILDRAAAWQVHHSLHAELVAAVLHVLPDRLLAPGQRLDPGLGPGEVDVDSVASDRLQHGRQPAAVPNHSRRRAAACASAAPLASTVPAIVKNPCAMPA